MRISFLISTAVFAPLLSSAADIIVNGGYEALTAPLTTTYTQTTTVQGWSTTATDGKIEIWQSGFQGVNTANGPAGSLTAGGSQFAEVNATQASTLYQDVTFASASGVDYSFLHRGRGGPDTLRLDITYFGLDGTLGTSDDQLVASLQVTDDAVQDAGEFNGWKQYLGDDVFTSVVNGTYRFGFTAVSTFNGNNSVGNFLDNAAFGIGVVPEPGTAGLMIFGIIGLITVLRKVQGRSSGHC